MSVTIYREYLHIDLPSAFQFNTVNEISDEFYQASWKDILYSIIGIQN